MDVFIVIIDAFNTIDLGDGKISIEELVCNTMDLQVAEQTMIELDTDGIHVNDNCI